MNKKFAIFDMDGTLVDSGTVWGQTSAGYFAGLGVTSPASLIEETAHLSMMETAARFVQGSGLPLTPEEVAEEINRRMELHYRTDIPLKPGAAPFLRRLQAAGVRMCVASSTAQPLIEACIQRLGVGDCFEFLLSSEEVGAGKDRPDVYLEAARRLGGGPEDTIVFEDLLFAVQTARSAGFQVAAVYDEASAGDEAALRETADFYFTRWDDPALAQWLGV